jgi:nicotinamide riboside kinase
MKITKVINLFGAPGSGKSTTAAGLFHLMKLAGYSVELVAEYAKQMVWDERKNIFHDQLYITAKQNRCLERLRGKVEWVITDSPLLLAAVYENKGYYPSFKPLLTELWNSYNNVNFLLQRAKPYVATGRNQTEAESDVIQTEIKDWLVFLRIDYTTLKGDEKAPRIIFDSLPK